MSPLHQPPRRFHALIRKEYLCWLPLLALKAIAATPDFAEVERIAEAELKERRIPGCALAIVSGDRIVFAKGLGVANVETRELVRSEMLFRLGSTTKMFTATAVLMLAEEGKLRLDRPVGDYVPGLHPQVARVTAAQLLSHTAGLRAEAPPDDGLHDDTALGNNIRQWKEDVFFTEPGKIFSYSNPGYWLAGLLAGTTERQYFADVLANRVFEPLGMTHSTFRPTMAMTFPLAIGHEPDDDNVPCVRRPFADNVAGWPSGQMFSNVHDLGRWCIALLNGGQLDGEQVLSASLIHELTAPHADMPGLDSKYGCGLQLDMWHGGRHWYHNGGRAGFGSFIRLAPDHKAAVILLMNVTMAAMPKTAEKAMELAASLNPPPAPEMSSAFPGLTLKRELPSVPLTQCAGRYRNGALSEELIARGDKLLRRRGTTEEELTAVVQIPFVTLTGQAEPLLVMTVNGKPEYFLVVGESGKPEFIFRGDIALARQSE